MKCCNQDCNQGRTCPNRRQGKDPFWSCVLVALALCVAVVFATRTHAQVVIVQPQPSKKHDDEKFKCYPGFARHVSNGLLCGPGVSGINPSNTQIDTRSAQERAVADEIEAEERARYLESQRIKETTYEYCQEANTFVVASVARPGCRLITKRR